MTNKQLIAKDIKTVKNIIKTVSRVWVIDPAELIGTTRRQPVAFARNLCMALAKQQTKMTQVQVGECFGNRHHTTVHYAIERINNAINDKGVMELTKEIIKGIKRDQLRAEIKTEA